MRFIGKAGAPVRETPVHGAGGAGGVSRSRSLFDREILAHAILDAVRKFNPRAQVRNPVMFVVLIGTIVTLIEAIAHPGLFSWSVTIWLALTVAFANFAEALAEGRGKAQANALRRMRTETNGRRLRPDGAEERVAVAELVKGDLVIAEAGDVIPSDGEIIEGTASVDESAITGESAPVIREAGGDRSAVTGGTTVLSDRIVVRITAERGHTFLDRMITLVEGASRRRTPNEIALAVSAPFLGRLPEGGMSLAAWPGPVPGRSGRLGRTAVTGSHSKALGTVSDLGASRSAPTIT